MKYYLGLLLLFSSSVFAGATSGSGNITNTLSLGGVSLLDDLNVSESNAQGYFTLYAGSTITAANFGPFFKNGAINAAGAYQVPPGFSFNVVKICAEAVATSAGFQLVSSTAAIGLNTGTALTNGIYQAGIATNNAFLTSVTSQLSLCFDTTYSFPSGSFPGFQGNSSTNYYIRLTGKETKP